jgi:hypothetical protein
MVHFFIQFIFAEKSSIATTIFLIYCIFSEINDNVRINVAFNFSCRFSISTPQKTYMLFIDSKNLASSAAITTVLCVVHFSLYQTSQLSFVVNSGLVGGSFKTLQPTFNFVFIAHWLNEPFIR